MRTATDSPDHPTRRRIPRGLADGMVLTGIVMASAVLYVGRLGFYSDDWAFLSVLHLAGDQSLAGLVGEQLGFHENLRMRPTQVVYQAVLYRLFGLVPLGYHLVNLAVLVAVALTLYLVLLRVGLPRVVAVAVPAVYALLPNYSTDRFWFAAFGYLLSVGLWLASVYADLRAVESPHRTWVWKSGAVAAFLGAGFGYEIVLALGLVNIVLAEVHARNRHHAGLRSSVGTGAWLAFHGATVAAAAAAAMYKAAVASGVGVENLPLHLSTLAVGAVVTDFGTHFAAAPHTAWSLAPAAGVAGVLVALGVAAAAYGYLRRIGCSEAVQAPPAGWAGMIVVGLSVYALGYAIFVTTERVGFSSTGIVNRVAAGAAIGFAVTVIAVAGWVASRVPWQAVSLRIMPAAVAGLCLCGTVVNNGLASFWADSWPAQQRVIADLQASNPHLPENSTVLLAGVCPYNGPAPVFESHWDLAGALQVAYRDPSLAADVVTPRMTLEAGGVRTRIYDMQVAYPYSDRLLMHDARRRRTVPLPDEREARREIGAVPDPECPPSQPGRGSLVLPFDELRGKVEGRVLLPLLGSR